MAEMDRRRAIDQDKAIADLRALLGADAAVVDYVGSVVTLEADGLTFEWQRARPLPGWEPATGDITYVAVGGKRTRISGLADLGDALADPDPVQPALRRHGFTGG